MERHTRWMGTGPADDSPGTAIVWEGRLPLSTDTTEQLPPAAIAIILAVRAELPDLATRLLIERPAVFDRYDRLIAEASVRVNMFPPLLILVATLAVRSHWLWWSAVAGCALLLYQGLLRKSRANAVVIDAVATRLIDSPTMLAIEAAYDGDGAPVDRQPAETSPAADPDPDPGDQHGHDRLPDPA